MAVWYSAGVAAGEHAARFRPSGLSSRSYIQIGEEGESGASCAFMWVHTLCDFRREVFRQEPKSRLLLRHNITYGVYDSIINHT
jgi:hypothetical protein